MCRYSIEGYKSFRAQEGDKVYTAFDGHSVGFFGNKEATDGHVTHHAGTVACLIAGDKITMEEVRFDPQRIQTHYGKNFVTGRSNVSIGHFAGLKNVVVTVCCWNGPEEDRLIPEDANSIMFEDGTRVHMYFLAFGLHATVGVHTLDKKLGLDTMTMVAGDNVTDPDPKPEGDEPTEKEQAPEQEKAPA